MERLSDAAIAIINALHTERIEYNSEYLSLIDAANKLSAYEDTGLEPEEADAIENALIGREIAKITEFCGVPVERLEELARAEREGRLLLLPLDAHPHMGIVRAGS